MSMACPRSQEFLRLLDGELTENRAALLRSHARGCAACASELTAQERLVARIAAPLPGLPSDGSLAAVMRRLDATAATQATPATSRRLRLAAASLAAAAAAILVVAVALPGRRDAEFTSRGATVEWTRKVGVELWALEGPPRRLAPGDRLASGVAIVASYSNVDPEPAWLLAYALDERGEVHWLYPGFLSAGTDPEAVRLDGSVVQRALPESVLLEDVPAGALRLVTVVAPLPLHVSEVESARPAERTPEALRSRWPGARIDELTVRFTAAHPATP